MAKVCTRLGPMCTDGPTLPDGRPPIHSGTMLKKEGQESFGEWNDEEGYKVRIPLWDLWNTDNLKTDHCWSSTATTNCGWMMVLHSMVSLYFFTCCLECIKSHVNCLAKHVCIIFTGEIETVDLALIPPLMKSWGGFIVLQTASQCTINYNLKHMKPHCYLRVYVLYIKFQ